MALSLAFGAVLTFFSSQMSFEAQEAFGRAVRGATFQLPSAAISTVTLLDVEMDRTPENGAGPVRRRVSDQPGAVEPEYQLG